MTMSINEAQAAKLDTPGDGVAEEVGVPCGVLRLVVGTLPADAAPAPAASVSPGPCP